MALSPQLWCVLTSFLLVPGRVVSIDSLIDHLWGDDAPQMARTTIRTYISRINSLLTQHLEARIHRYAHGYRLNIDPQAVDLHRFRSLKRQAEAVAESGDLHHAAALLGQAAELWQGPALAGLPGDWISRVSLGLEDEHYEGTRFRIKIEMALGHQGSLLGELRELTEQHPFDGEIITAWMTALFRSGRQAEALQVGREASERFAETGMDPSPELLEVHERILRNDVVLGVTPAYRRAGRVFQPNTLPPEATDFTGRTAEVEMLTRDCRLGNAPLFAIIEGMPGVGKTALAVRVAHQMTGRYPDAQLYLSFSTHDGKGDPLDVGDALQRLLRMLDVPAGRIPRKTGERTRLWRHEMAHRRAVVVLDDVPDAEQIQLIKPTVGDSLTIATSRRHASWPGGRVLSLAPLEADEATRLLRQMIGPAAEYEAVKVAEAARLCGGLPLAIRIAAGRLRGGDPGELDELIGELTDFHVGHVSGETGRHVFSAFEYSYSQLTAAQKRFFRLLGDSPCADMTLPITMALTGESEVNAGQAISVLLDHYLLERTSADRFRFHDIIHSYASARCAEDEPEAARRRAVTQLMHYYSQTLDVANKAIREPSIHEETISPGSPAPFPDAEAAQVWLEAEWRNILLIARYAARHESHQQCADLTHAIAEFLETNGYWSDALAAHELALQACRNLDDPVRVARAALELSDTSMRTGSHRKASQHASEALEIYTSSGDQHGRAECLDQLGLIHRNSGRFRDALAHHQEAMDLYRTGGDQRGMAKAVMHAATALGNLGRYDEEIRGLNEALGLFRAAVDRRGEARVLNNLGAVLDDRGFHRDAVENYEKSLTIFRQIGGRHNLAMLDQNMGRVQSYKGNYDKAITLYRKALTTFYTIGDLPHQAIVLCDIGVAFNSKDCYSEALVHHEKAAGIAELIGDQGQLAAALCGMGDSYRGSHSYPTALETYERALRLAAEIEVPYLRAKAQCGIAETLLNTRGIGAARIHWRKALDIFGQLGVPEAAFVELRLRGLGASAS